MDVQRMKLPHAKEHLGVKPRPPHTDVKMNKICVSALFIGPPTVAGNN